MGLKLMVEAEDKITMSNGVVIDVRFIGKQKAQLEFTAPKEVEINAIFKDSSKMFKNLRKP
jgi:hypothetical protein